MRTDTDLSGCGRASAEIPSMPIVNIIAANNLFILLISLQTISVRFTAEYWKYFRTAALQYITHQTFTAAGRFAGCPLPCKGILRSAASERPIFMVRFLYGEQGFCSVFITF